MNLNSTMSFFPIKPLKLTYTREAGLNDPSLTHTHLTDHMTISSLIPEINWGNISFLQFISHVKIQQAPAKTSRKNAEVFIQNNDVFILI